MHKVAFIGSGGIAAAHAYALDSLPYYYEDGLVMTQKKYVASRDLADAERFRDRYAFQEALSVEELFVRDDFDTLFLLSPNQTHFEYLARALAHPAILRVYIEKPICCGRSELEELYALGRAHPKRVQVGFQFLQMAALTEARRLWAKLEFGPCIHFRADYLHGDYLDPEYRERRKGRLVPAPAGGALADLGSHALSILVIFLGGHLQIRGAHASGSFKDVPVGSDLCTQVTLVDGRTLAVGTMTASRISYGSGDRLEFELHCTRGSLRFTSNRPDALQFCHSSQGDNWSTVSCGNNFSPWTTFPNAHVPSGWLRSLIHAHFLFLGECPDPEGIPDLQHGIEVQRLVLDCLNHLDHSHEPHSSIHTA